MATSATTTAAVLRQLSQKEQDIQMMLAAEVHLGTKNCNFQMERYVFKRRNDVLKFSQYTGANAIARRNTLGTFTNQMQTSYNEPRLLILTDPRTDHQPIKEGALGNILTIAFCDTDSSMRYVDVGIPANNKGKHSIGCLFWLLGRMVLQMRGTIHPGLKWDVMVDLFFYREAEEAKQQEEEELPAPEYAIQDFGAAGIAGFPAADGEWGLLQLTNHGLNQFLNNPLQLLLLTGPQTPVIGSQFQIHRLLFQHPEVLPPLAGNKHS
ncbi:40S ribosomal protein [Arachis hypogaea]|nr:40S ribosomal protein [Arachis hypogaea]